MPDFSDYFRGYQEQAARPQPSRDSIARMAVEKRARTEEAARNNPVNILFRRTLAQAADTLTRQGRPTQPHYLGIPIGSINSGGPFYAGRGFTERMIDGYGWALQYRLQSSPQGWFVHEAFLKDDGSGIIHGSGDTVPVLPINHQAAGVVGLTEDSPVVEHGNRYYLMENHRAGWRTAVTQEEHTDGGFVVQDGELMKVRSQYGFAERYELVVESYAAELARLAVGGNWQ